MDNKRIHIVIGASCAGKSSFTRNTWIRDREFNEYKDITWVCELDDVFLLGCYSPHHTDPRRVGSDRISRSEIPLILPQIDKILTTTNKPIVMEGEKVISRPLWNALIDHGWGEQMRIYYMRCDLETSLKRNVENGSTQRLGMLKRLHTMSENIYKEYKDILDFYIVDTDNVKDFTKLKYE